MLDVTVGTRCVVPLHKACRAEYNFRNTQRPFQKPFLRRSNKFQPFIRAIEVSGPQGSSPAQPSQEAVVSPQISAEIIETMRKKIAEALEAHSVEITDTYGDGRHVSIDVVSDKFEGQSSMNRQRAVYKSIWLELQDTVHAVDAMTTKTRSEAGT